MKEIKNVTKEIEEQAYRNVEGFNHTELCYKTIFEMLNDCGLFVRVFRELTTYLVEDKNQIGLKTFKYGFAKGEDEKVYPIVDLIVWLRDKVIPFQTSFCLTLTPFNASMDNEFKNAGVYGGCDKQLTKIWRIVVKGFFKDKWVEAFKRYCSEVKNIKESEVATKAEMNYLKIQEQYETEINSI